MHPVAMKNNLHLLVLGLSALSAFPLPNAQPGGTNVVVDNPAAYSITSRGPHSRVWEHTEWQTNLAGRAIARKHTYTELATGMHRWSGNQWVDASSQIQITATGAAASNAQHQVSFLGNLNTAGAIDVTTPDGKHLVSNILGLSYFDTATGKSVMVAETKDCIGQVLPSGNQAIYQDAFDGTLADILYVNTSAAFEQLVILRQQLPSPTEWALDPATTVLQVITEFPTAPIPQISERTISGASDQHLNFGIMHMGKGVAFALDSVSNPIPVTKQWLVLSGRTCLVEQTPLSRIWSALKKLPPAPPGTTGLGTPLDSNNRRVASKMNVPSPRKFRRDTKSLKLATSPLKNPGFALDYVLLNTGFGDLTLQSDTTYYVSGDVTVSNLTIEGGAVIKYTNTYTFSPAPQVSIGALDSATWVTSQYRPAIFTAKDDNTVGESIAGSTSNPTTNYYCSGPALSFGDLVGSSNHIVVNARFSYLDCAIDIDPVVVRNVQAVNCNTFFYATTANFDVRNALFYNISTISPASGKTGPTGKNFIGQNVTIHNCTNVFADTTGTAAFTNCLLVCVTNWLCATNYTNNTVVLSSDSGVFQTVAAASHYLAQDSPYHGIGTTNIEVMLLYDLRGKTTYPPISYSNVTLAADTTLGPQAQRDAGASVDLGYHFDPLDYYMSQTLVTNSTLTLLRALQLAFIQPMFGTVSALALEQAFYLWELRTIRCASPNSQPCRNNRSPCSPATSARTCPRSFLPPQRPYRNARADSPNGMASRRMATISTVIQAPANRSLF
ncbi:MAG: hypothetical protein C5B50_10635 [Verrucomicrobia bacterium]|nr:MAG: hypothetical protein C5B50_10635 [Verrucomicrobiota bacterium]